MGRGLGVPTQKHKGTVEYSLQAARCPTPPPCNLLSTSWVTESGDIDKKKVRIQHCSLHVPTCLHVRAIRLAHGRHNGQPELGPPSCRASSSSPAWVPGTAVLFSLGVARAGMGCGGASTLVYILAKSATACSSASAWHNFVVMAPCSHGKVGHARLCTAPQLEPLCA